jgi:flavin-dependent dehydrogenase
MIDVLIAGAGPAGSIAAIVLARAGARVLIFERDRFPRDKLCGDTLSPGAVSLIRSLDLDGRTLDRALPLAGMRLTGPGASVTARYDGVSGLAIRRRDLDAWLAAEAVRAGARVEEGIVADRALIQETGSVAIVRGVVLRPRTTGAEIRMPALMTIAADGRRSALGRSLHLNCHPATPRRWAFGTYASGVVGLSDLGEMHIRAGWYLGIAPLPGGIANVCLVVRPQRERVSPRDLIMRAIAAEPELADRFASAAFHDKVSALGPLAVEARSNGVPGLLLAGDASGFIDPMTGDGLYLAMRGAMLAAIETRRALETGELGKASSRLLTARRRAFGTKVRFNRVVRRLVDMPVGLRLATRGALLAPAAVRYAVRYAGGAL